MWTIRWCCRTGGCESTGNFHGAPLGFAADFLAIAAAEVGAISERRVDRLLDVTRSRELPAFLSPDPGVNSGLMIAQYTAAGIVAENRRLAAPASVDSLPTSGMQEDHVSMGWAADGQAAPGAGQPAQPARRRTARRGARPAAAGAPAPVAGRPRCCGHGGGVGEPGARHGSWPRCWNAVRDLVAGPDLRAAIEAELGPLPDRLHRPTSPLDRRVGSASSRSEMIGVPRRDTPTTHPPLDRRTEPQQGRRHAARARKALPRWLIASFSAGVSSALVRAVAVGDEDRVVAEAARSRGASRTSRPRCSPWVTISRPSGSTSGGGADERGPRCSSGTSATCASSSSRFARSSPCLPAHRALNTPGIPLSASTAMPESSAIVGSPVCRTPSRAFSKRVVGERQPGLGNLHIGRNVVEPDDVDGQRGCAAVRRASSRCGSPAGYFITATALRCSSVSSRQPATPRSSSASSSAAAEHALLAGALHLDEVAGAGADDVHVDVGDDVLLVAQVQPRLAADDADADRRHRALQHRLGRPAELAPAGQPLHRVVQRHVRAGDRRGAGAAVGLQHVAVDDDGVLAERLEVDAGAQRPPDQPGDLVGAPADLPADALAVVAGGRGAGQHGVLGGEPAEAGALAPARHALGDAGGAQHPGLAELDEHRALRVQGPVPGQGHAGRSSSRCTVIGSRSGTDS